MAKNPYLTDQSKHIEVQYYYVRESQECGKANIIYVPIDKMVVDVLGKLVSKPLLEQFRKQVGMAFGDQEKRGSGS